MVIDFEYYVDLIKQTLNAGDNENGKKILRFLLSRTRCGDSVEGYTQDEVLTLSFLKMFRNYVDCDSIKGCLLGGAIGDALGYPVEFLTSEEIIGKYGQKGITELQLTDGKARFSDDTQMTLFTADGLIHASQRFINPTADNYVESVYESYLNWLYTQDKTAIPDKNVYRSELLKIDALHRRRDPGNTCLTALKSGKCGTFTHKLNDSKGCGGIMRVAPVALYLSQIKDFEENDIAIIAARIAAVTHGHVLGYIPAAYLAALLCFILRGYMLMEASYMTDNLIKKLFPDYEDTKKCLKLIERAREMAIPSEDEDGGDDSTAIRSLGEGWVAEETLAIALYCSLKYTEDFEKAIITAVNHDGDSDSTGAVTGNILGAYSGLRGIPQKMIDGIEMKETIMGLAEKLHINKLSTEVK